MEQIRDVKLTFPRRNTASHAMIWPENVALSGDRLGKGDAVLIATVGWCEKEDMEMPTLSQPYFRDISPSFHRMRNSLALTVKMAHCRRLFVNFPCSPRVNELEKGNKTKNSILRRMKSLCRIPSARLSRNMASKRRDCG